MDLEKEGYRIIRSVFTEEEVARFREEADRVAAAAGSACVRHLRSHSGLFRDLALEERLRVLLPGDPVLARSILFDKTPEENWPVAWHQDLTIALRRQENVPGYGPWSVKDGAPHVQPPVALLRNMVTIRIHLDDTPADNGALAVVPGSHLHGRIPAYEVATYVRHPVICECQSGDILLMSPLILHSSKRAVTPRRRRIIHFEYAREGDLAENLEWLES
ncbi:phytanoyl-CoA dioxygenase family protein [Luteolibacter sp. SL250]|uniref:phytanoyl-CoA dioxygenase family protein n=1 Tax=Luteolibacter sp. SL250 TaxID=2995170 RepID=UPI002272150B|nr:phytanoyl-CoA dioxygenase family protein [Luteolibacter sp. SL250]WAC21828.1 phytanoyl-CoA dioxygenase family protein [Luteolibacter sp. SL250]